MAGCLGLVVLEEGHHEIALHPIPMEITGPEALQRNPQNDRLTRIAIQPGHGHRHRLSMKLPMVLATPCNYREIYTLRLQVMRSPLVL